MMSRWCLIEMKRFQSLRKFVLMHLYHFFCVRETRYLYKAFCAHFFNLCIIHAVIAGYFSWNNLGFSQNLISGMCVCLLSFTISKENYVIQVNFIRKEHLEEKRWQCRNCSLLVSLFHPRNLFLQCGLVAHSWRN